MIETEKVDRLYIIGDIHGRLDLLKKIEAEINRDLDDNAVSHALTVTLGDYVDRGPDSRGVLDRLTHNPFPTPFIPLKGNHEVVLEDFLRDASVGSYWRRLGGLETLHSYGIPVASLQVGKGFDRARDALCKAMSETHLEFLSSLKLFLSFRNYFLCHAGVRPGISLEHQRPQDLLWIRDEFLTSKFDFGKIIVHGHTPTQEPEILPNRINIDTGAFATGRLTCLVLDGDRRRILST